MRETIQKVRFEEGVGPLRPVPTLDQVMRLPDPVIWHPYREIEVSRPDPNLF